MRTERIGLVIVLDQVLSPATFRVAMCGTFDIKNYGDLLFPLVLRHELTAVETELFSYHAKTPASWPYAVSSITSLASRIHTFDAVVIGGGHLIRFDKEIAAGYVPPSKDFHHPTSYWLLPAMLAQAAGIPVIWSAVGASPDLPEWGRDLLRETLPASAYISVRDVSSQRQLQALADHAEVRLVPDTGFGIARLLGTPARAVKEPYVLLQSTPHLTPQFESIKRLLAGRNVVLMPISPGLADQRHSLPNLGGINVEWHDWSDPLAAAALIANADAVFGVSLHLSITAMAYGVPVIRPFENPLAKYRELHNAEGIHQLESYTGSSLPPTYAPMVHTEALRAHWDTIAAIIRRPRTTPRKTIDAAALQRLPFEREPKQPGYFRRLFKL